MPVMEAMASGLAVVAARCLGVQTFARHAQNCLLADPQACAALHPYLPIHACGSAQWLHIYF